MAGTANCTIAVIDRYHVVERAVREDGALHRRPDFASPNRRAFTPDTRTLQSGQYFVNIPMIAFSMYGLLATLGAVITRTFALPSVLRMTEAVSSWRRRI